MTSEFVIGTWVLFIVVLILATFGPDIHRAVMHFKTRRESHKRLCAQCLRDINERHHAEPDVVPGKLAEGTQRFADGGLVFDDRLGRARHARDKQRGFSDLWLPIGFGVLIVVYCVVMWYGIRDEHRQWVKFAQEHECKVVGKMSGDVLSTTVVGVNGQVSIGSTYVSGKTGYACNDGVTYWR